MVEAVIAASQADYGTALMLQARAGDTASFDALVQMYRQPVIQYIWRLVRDPVTAEDLTQDVFLRAFTARERYAATARARTWLFCIATNLALNHLRNARYRRRFEVLPRTEEGHRPLEARDPQQTQEDRILRREYLGRIRQAVDLLPERQRAAVLLHKYECMDYVQISATLGCSVTATKSILFRAYETLRGELAAAGLK
jgi:RNA polymerase sigma-70 factor, ECF subfamily